MRVNDQEVKFNIFKAIKFPNDVDERYQVDVVDTTVNEGILESYVSDFLEFPHGVVPN